MTGILSTHLRDKVVQPTLSYLAERTGLPLNSDAAIMLLIGTQAHESLGHQYLVQYPEGPAVSGYQMERRTHDDTWSTYLDRRIDLREAVLSMVPTNGNTADRMIYDLAYATAMARIHYWRVPEPLPEADNIVGLARYWKVYWNTVEGAGSIDQFIHDFKHYALEAMP